MSTDAATDQDPDRTGPLDFTGKVVIVTGGSKGLGRAFATRFLEAGADVVICARKAPETLPAAGGREAVFVAADVRDPEQVEAVVATTVERFGRIDVLVNNAGGAPVVASGEATHRFNERVLALNLLAPITFAIAAHRHMEHQPEGGVIINISSVSGSRANPFGVAYGAAKAGLNNVAETLALEWGPTVRVLTMIVGLIVTDADEAAGYYGGEEGIRAIGDLLPMKHMGEPGEVADMCLALASPLARWVTGTAIDVHGGGEMPSYLTRSTGLVSPGP